MTIRRAIILSAGRGERLRPITDTLPKPLVKVGNKYLLAHHLEKLAKAGVKQVVINHAWLGAEIEQAIGDGSQFGLQIIYSPEPEGGLETAGGILQALDLLSENNQPFLVINGDVFTDYNFDNLLAKELNNNLAHLILVPNPNFKESGDFGLAEKKVTNQAQFTFSGISLLSPLLFSGLEPGRSKLAPLIRKQVANNQVSGELHSGYWNDVGTHQRLKEAIKYATNRITR